MSMEVLKENNGYKADMVILRFLKTLKYNDLIKRRETDLPVLRSRKSDFLGATDAASEKIHKTGNHFYSCISTTLFPTIKMVNIIYYQSYLFY